MKIEKEILMDLHNRQKLPYKQIADVLNCEIHFIQYYIKKYNLPRRPKRVRHQYLNISHSFRLSIYHCLIQDKHGRSWENIVGYTLNDLRNHLERHFEDGMTWDNYGKFGWHIDHIIPVSVFNFKSIHDIDFKRCWALSNLRPLWAEENWKKNNKLSKPFQPSILTGEV